MIFYLVMSYYTQRICGPQHPWKPGMMEGWNIGFFEKESLFQYSNIPIFHYSDIFLAK